MNIVAKKIGDQWKAWIEDDPQKFAFGKSKHEAIGRLVSDYQKVFIVTIKEL